MSKKAQKSLFANNRTNRNQSPISFNKFGFTLGNTDIITDDLSEQLREIIVGDYKEKKFDKDLYESNVSKHHLYKEKQKIVLLESDAIDMILKLDLKSQKQYTSQIFERQKLMIQCLRNSQIEQKKSNSKNYLEKRIYQLDLDSTELAKTDLEKLENQKEIQTQKLKELAQAKSLKIESEILTQSIVMIIEKESQTSNSENELAITKSIVVFEQSYPFNEFEKLQLIQMIGQKAYESKLLAALKIYHYSITNTHFFNPLFLVCHSCMKVIGCLDFPQENLNCTKKIEQHQNKNITSKFTHTPFTYLKKIIQGHHFSSEDYPFAHPYIQYFPDRTNNQLLACNRRWCGPCFSKYNQSFKLQPCQFCNLECKCLRCHKFKKFVKLLAFYLHFGGNYDQIRPKFLFSRIFDTKHFNLGDEKVTSYFSAKHSFSFLEELQKMHEKYVRNQLIDRTQEWKKMENSRIISGSVPQTSKQFQLLKETWQKNRIKQKSRIDLFEKAFPNQIPRKQNFSKRSQKIEGIIQHLNEETKKKIIESQLEQQKIFINQILSSGVLRTTNPLQNPFFKNKAHEVIIQQSQMQRNQQQFSSRFEIGANLTRHRECMKEFFRLQSQIEIEKEEKK